MTNVLARNWWALALRGVAAILFGVLAFIWPGLTVAALVLLFGAYALWDGIFAIVAAVRQRGTAEQWVWLLVEGLAGIVLGLVTFFWPGITAIALLYLIAAWAIVTGIFEIMTAIRLRKEIDNEWLLMLGGLLSVVLGIFMMVMPGAGALGLIWAIASYSIVFGVLMILLAFRLRNVQNSSAPVTKGAT